MNKEYPKPRTGDRMDWDSTEGEDFTAVPDDARTPGSPLRDEPENMYQEVAWMLSLIDHAKNADFARLKKEPILLKAAEDCKRIQAEGENPTSKDFKLLCEAYEMVCPESRHTKDDLRRYYAALHGTIGCPECEWGIVNAEGNACGGPDGKSTPNGCGWTST